MQQPEAPEKKTKGILDRLPKLGRSSQLILLIGIFIAVFAGLLLLNRQLTTTEKGLKSNLTNLQRILNVQQTPQAKYEAELAQVTADTEAAKATFPEPNQAPEILDVLRELAEQQNIAITKTAVSEDTPKGSIGPVLTVELGLSGQVPMFENFLLGLDSKLPTSQIKKLTFSYTG
jgi:hypothetical protein